MVYDEGFEIKLHGISYFAFSKYIKQENGVVESHCGETLIGWYHDTKIDQRGCYRAEKIEENQAATDQAHNEHII